MSLKDNETLASDFLPVLIEKGLMVDIEYVQQVVGLVKDRANFVSELWEQASFFFVAPDGYDEKAVKKRWKQSSYDQMLELKDLLAQTEPFTAEHTEEVVKKWLEEKEYGMGAVMNAFRLLVVGALKGPHLFDIIAMLGQEETLQRIQTGLHELGRKE